LTFIQFEDLLARPKASLAALLERLGLRLEEVTLRPTFNGIPIASDSSFGAKFGVDRSAADRSRHVSAEDAELIRERTGEI
jgi:hypothetical protein